MTQVSRTRYSPEEIETGLRALALCNGNSRKAKKLLSDQGQLAGVSHMQIYRWGNKLHIDRYEQVRTEELEHAHERATAEMEQIRDSFMDSQRKAASKLNKALDKEEQSAVELSTISRNSSVAFGITNQHITTARGRPNVITQESDIPELLRFLERTGVVTANPALLEGTAVEVESK